MKQNLTNYTSSPSRLSAILNGLGYIILSITIIHFAMLWIFLANIQYERPSKGKLYAYLADGEEITKQYPSIGIYYLSDTNEVILEYDGNFVTYKELSERMKRDVPHLVTKDERRIPFRICAEEKAPLQSFINVVDICQQAGVGRWFMGRLKRINLDASEITTRNHIGYYIPQDTSRRIQLGNLISTNPHLKKSIHEKGGLTGWFILLVGLAISIIAGLYLIRVRKLKTLSDDIMPDAILRARRNLNIFPIANFIVLLIGFIGVLLTFYSLSDEPYLGVYRFRFIYSKDMTYSIYKMLVIILECILVTTLGIILHSYFVGKLNSLIFRKESAD